LAAVASVVAASVVAASAVAALVAVAMAVVRVAAMVDRPHQALVVAAICPRPRTRDFEWREEQRQ
jgi:hypothetical protein